MKIDLAVAWGHNRGGKGIKANYETKLMRVPAPLEGIIKEICRRFTRNGIITEIGDTISEDFMGSREYRAAVEIARAEWEKRQIDIQEE
jgi:hypothetical protein